MKSIIPQPATPSKKVKWAGRVMSALPVVLLVFSASMKFMKPPPVLEGFAHFGIAERLVLFISSITTRHGSKIMIFSVRGAKATTRTDA